MSDTKTLVETLGYVKQFSGKTVLLKLGGSILTDSTLVKSLCEDLSLMRAANMGIVIVHGGGKAIDKALASYQVSSTTYQGQRVTTPDMMDIIEMVIGGQVNPLLVRTLSTVGMPAIGLKGTDNQLLQCECLSPALGQVGKVTHVNKALLNGYITQQFGNLQAPIPVIAPIGINSQGQAMNINADWAATSIAVAMGIDKVIYLTDQEGIYDQRGDIISCIDYQHLQALIDDCVIDGGMIPKANAIMHALSQGIEQVHIINGSKAHALLTELYTDAGIGTICMPTVKESAHANA